MGHISDEVYAELKTKTRDAILALVEKERTGEQVDRALLKNVLGIFIEVLADLICLSLPVNVRSAHEQGQALSFAAHIM